MLITPEHLTRTRLAERLFSLQNASCSAIVDRLNHSPDQPHAYPVALSAAALVYSIIDVAIERCLLIDTNQKG